MAKVVTPYTYLDGRKLTTEHNKNIFSADGDEGIMSEPNGGLSSTNLASDFLVQKEHVHPEEVYRLRQDSAKYSSDYMSDALGNSSEDAAFVPIAGTATRVYLPYAVSAALWQVSFFYSSFRVYHNNNNAISTPDIYVKMYVDGTSIDHTWRSLPMSAPMDRYIYREDGSSDDREGTIFGAENEGVNRVYEAISGTGYMDWAHLAQDVSAGWHDVVAQIFMEHTVTGAGAALTADFHTGVGDDERGDRNREDMASVALANRATFGFRNARVLTFL